MIKLNIVTKPIDQTWTIKRIAQERPSPRWESVFTDSEHELADISDVLDEQERLHGMYYPLKKDIFAALNYTPLTNVKVVILGQDPYHQTILLNGISMPRAVGLSFSVHREDSIPSSLQNIYTELANTVRGFRKPDHGDLREWANQGVLLLNACLTVRPNMAGSHGDIWLGFIRRVFKAITIANPYCIYMLWGREAQKLRPMLGEHSIVLEAAHPSGLSARRGFFGCNHFNLANEALIRQGKVGINWSISSSEVLQGSGTSIGTPIVHHTANVHQPIFAPITPMSAMISAAPAPTISYPIVMGINPAKSQSPKYNQVSLLPTIPNTKPLLSVGNNSNVLPPTIHDLPVTEHVKPAISVDSKYPKMAPIIPTIKFGLNLNTTMAPTMDGLPIVPLIVKPQMQTNPSVIQLTAKSQSVSMPLMVQPSNSQQSLDIPTMTYLTSTAIRSRSPGSNQPLIGLPKIPSIVN